MRTAHAALLSIFLMLVSAPGVLAADPAEGTGGPPAGDVRPPLSPEQAASQRLKEAAIANTTAAAGKGSGTQYCPTMTGTQGYCGPSTPWRVVLAVQPRQQERCDWCGPAVAQIMSNYTYRTTGNVYHQGDIAYWMGTSRMDCTGDGWADGGTCLGYFIDTLNAITVRPANWAYIWKFQPSYNDWHNTIISGVHTWRMPLAATVRPWTLDNQFRLASWPNKSHGGHYIELHGYEGYASTSGARVYYSDPAGVCGSGTAAGNWAQQSWVVWRVMMDHGYLVY